MMQDVSTGRGPDRAHADRLLEIVNAAPSEAILADALAKAGDVARLDAIVPALFSARAGLGSFRDVDELEAVEGLGRGSAATLIDALFRPPFRFDTETLECITWAHGGGIAVDTPETFGAVERLRSGLRLTSFRGRPDTNPIGFSWAHVSVPASSFEHGKQVFVRAVLLNWAASVQPFTIQGIPAAAPYEFEVWDGHTRIAQARVPSTQNPSNRYMRIPVDSARVLQWGLSVSLHLAVAPVFEDNPGRSLEIGAVGVELVSRTGLVVAPS